MMKKRAGSSISFLSKTSFLCFRVQCMTLMLLRNSLNAKGSVIEWGFLLLGLMTQKKNTLKITKLDKNISYSSESCLNTASNESG